MATDLGIFKFHGVGVRYFNYNSTNRNVRTSLYKRPRLPKNFPAAFTAISTANTPSISTLELVREFNPTIQIEDADTPPSSWYTDPSFYSFELERVFYRGWQAVGYVDQVKDAHDYFTGRLGTVEYVVCRDGEGKLHAFHNVCRHHASLLADGAGHKSCFVCPYHGWTYGFDGALLKATRITDPQKLNINEFGLIPINVAIWGPFVVINLEEGIPFQSETGFDSVGGHWLGSCSKLLSDSAVDSTLSFVCRRDYTIECNWKVYCDNYLDGGYHVPYAHRGLASGLKFETYTTEIFEKVSIQKCISSMGAATNGVNRLGSKAIYAFVYPNFMINRYGPWMDTNLVIPLGPRKCKVVFDYFLDASLKARLVVTPETETNSVHIYTLNHEQGMIPINFMNKDDKAFIERSLKDSEQVQIEDIVLCENVQKGLESPAYNCGRYAANVEEAMHHFHCLLHKNLME